MLTLSLAAPAQATGASGNGRGRVLSQITLANTTDLDFGRVVSGPTAGRAVIAQGTGVRTVSGGVTAAGGTPQRATFVVQGTPARQFTFAMPASVTLTNGTGGTMVVNTFRRSGALNLPASGIRTLFVGARLNVAANQISGTYTGSFAVTVDYQ